MQDRSWIRFLVVVFFMLLIVKAGIHLVSVIQLEAQGPVDIDYLLYAVVGRGILNGIPPYTGLYEGRPPGMFLLSAASMALTRGAYLANAVQVFFLAALPLLPVLFVANRKQWQWKSRRVALLILVAFLAGALLTLLLEEMTAVLQAEFFGAAFGCLYVFMISDDRHGLAKTRIVVASLFLLCSIGIKEPFLFTTFAAGILLTEKPRDVISKVVIPLFLALIAGTLILLLAGWFSGFIDIYLPYMLTKRLSVGVDPLFLRGFAVRRLYGSLIAFAHSPLTGIFIALLFISTPLLQRKGGTGWRSTLLTLSLGIASLLLLHGVYNLTMFVVARQRGIIDPLIDFSFWMNPLSLLVFLALWIPLCIMQYRDTRTTLRHLMLAMGGVVLVSFAFGAGGTYNFYHAGFGIPVYFALIILFLRSLSDAAHTAWMPVHAVMMIVVILAVLFYRQNPQVRESVLSQLRNSAQENMNHIAAVDGMLDSCGIDRYFSVNTIKHLAFARHSPIGPMHQFGGNIFIRADDPLSVRTIENIKKEAQVLLLEGNTIDMRFKDFLLTKFTDVPRDCAKPFLPIPDIKVFFRKANTEP